MLSELRSVIPENVNVMALTATATVSTKREIIKILDMQKPVMCQFFLMTIFSSVQLQEDLLAFLFYQINQTINQTKDNNGKNNHFFLYI